MKIKHNSGKFRFVRIVSEDGEEWVECLDMKSGKYRRFWISQIAGPVIKRSLCR